MNKETYIKIMMELEKIYKGLLAIDNSGFFTINDECLYYNLVNIVEDAVGDGAGITSYILDSFVESPNHYASFVDFVKDPEVERTFTDWESVYDFISSMLYKSNIEEYNDVIWDQLT